MAAGFVLSFEVKGLFVGNDWKHIPFLLDASIRQQGTNKLIC